MASEPLPRWCLQEALDLYETHKTYPEAARYASVVDSKRIPTGGKGISPQTFTHRIQTARRQGLVADVPKIDATEKPRFRVLADGSFQHLSGAMPQVVTKFVEETIPSREKARLLQSLTALKTELRNANKELNAQDDMRSAIFKLADQIVSPPDWIVNRAPAHSSPGVPILLCSDFQWGEVVAKEELDGIIEFNRDVAARRYKQLIETTIDLSFSHMVNPTYPGLIYLSGGDMISGEIHDELARTNDLMSIPAVCDLVEKQVWGLTQLADAFGKVHYIGVPGNHGRTTIKPHSKRYASTNYDTLISYMIESWFKSRGDNRITFWVPPSGDALFPVYGYNFLLTHGDRIGSRGGQGFIGPAATIARGMKKLIDYYAGLGRSIDYCLIGHFHTALELEYGWSNGSMPGYGEYARDFRFRPKPPSQWLLFCHPTWGVTARWQIMLEKRLSLAESTRNFSTFGVTGE